MAKNIYAVVGTFAMKPGSIRGIHTFRYEPETAQFTAIGDFRTEINAGQRTYNKEKDVCYITHESKDRDGGKILSFKLNHETGEPEWLNEKYTCSTLPSFVTLDKTGKYLLVPHHTSDNIVVKTVRNEDGSITFEDHCDSCTIVVFKVNEDGSIGDICDIYEKEPKRENGVINSISRYHNCIQSPDGKLVLVCDKGNDVMDCFKFDAECGKLTHVNEVYVEEHAHPRYAIFHPELPVVYQNCEASAFIHVWNYDSETGEMKRIQKLPLLADEAEAAAWTKEGAADLVMSTDGKYLYASVRGLNVLTVFAIGEDGTLAFLQNIDCQGKNPRGLCLSPDEKYLFSLNRDSDCIARFERGEDGTLEAAGCETYCGLPGNMMFICYE